MLHTRAERELSTADDQAMEFEEGQDPIDEERRRFMDHASKVIGQMCEVMMEIGTKVKDKDLPGALKDFGDGIFKYNGADIIKFIEGVTTIIDPIILIEYLGKINRELAALMGYESQFRQAIKLLETKWARNVRLKILPMPLMPPNEAASKERRIQLSRLRNAYKVVPTTLNEENGVINLYPDDNLLQVARDIVGLGEHYTNKVGFDVGFNRFLSELEELVKRHEERELPAHVNLDLRSAQSKEQQYIITVLALLRLYSRLESVVYEQQEQTLSHLMSSEKQIKALYDEIARLEKQIVDLKMQVQLTNVNQEQLKLLKHENSQLKLSLSSAKTTEKQLRRDIARQETQLAAKDLQIERYKRALAEKNILIDELSRDNESLMHATGSDISGAEMTDDDALESISPQGSSPPKKTTNADDAARLGKARKKLFNDTQSGDSSFSASHSPKSVSPQNVVKSQGVVDSKKGFFQPCGAQELAAIAVSTYPTTVIDNIKSVNSQQSVTVGGSGPGF